MMSSELRGNDRTFLACVTNLHDLRQAAIRTADPLVTVGRHGGLFGEGANDARDDKPGVALRPLKDAARFLSVSVRLL
jgi:hypothetical protein